MPGAMSTALMWAVGWSSRREEVRRQVPQALSRMRGLAGRGGRWAGMAREKMERKGADAKRL